MDETNDLASRERSNMNSTESLQRRSPFQALDLMPREPHLLDYLLILRKHQWLITFFPARSCNDCDDFHLPHATHLRSDGKS